MVKTKFQEIDLNLLKLFNNISDLSSQIPSASENFAPKVTSMKKREEDINMMNALNTNSSSKTNVDNFYKEFNDFKGKIDDEIKTINKNIKLKIKSSNIEVVRSSQEPNENLTNPNLVSSNLDGFKTLDLNQLNNNSGGNNNQFIISSINQLQENDKLVLQNLTYKVNREELEKLQRHMSQEIERAVISIFNYLR